MTSARSSARVVPIAPQTPAAAAETPAPETPVQRPPQRVASAEPPVTTQAVPTPQAPVGGFSVQLSVRATEKEAEAQAATTGSGKYEFLLQGTLYPDVIESISFKGPSATIKTHHNVGGLLEDMKLKLIEPLRELFKDEVRELGMLMGIPKHLVMRHPFPGPGLAIRILGPVTREQVKLLQQVDRIYLDEIWKAGVYNDISQAFAVLLPVRAVGVQGDKRTYDQVIAVRAASTSEFMTATWYPFDYALLSRISNRITNEVQGVNRVVLDVSSKPPATIEWL